MPFIEHQKVQDLLSLTMLVYDYSKKFTLDENETIETFVEDLEQSGGNLNLSNERQCALKDLSEKSPHGQIVDFISDKETDLQVAVTISETNKRFCVVFRGSESKSDWYYDLMIAKHNLHDDVWVHMGFHTQLTKNNVYNKLLEKINELNKKYPDYEVYVTGHSLGAALSTLFGYMLSREKPKLNVTVVSFASPRVGDYEWKKQFENRENLTHYRITNERDVVTAVPMFYYQHVGINIKLNDKSYNIFSKGEYPWYQYSLFNCWKASDHDCDLYYTRLCKNKWNVNDIDTPFF